MTKLAIYLFAVGVVMLAVNASAKDTCTFRFKDCMKIMNEQIKTFGKPLGQRCEPRLQSCLQTGVWVDIKFCRERVIGGPALSPGGRQRRKSGSGVMGRPCRGCKAERRANRRPRQP
jgi:hypothetical protein